MDSALLAELRTRFDALRKDLKFKATFDDLERVFFLTDLIAEKKFVSENLDRTVCNRIMDIFMGWFGFLHGILVPNPNSIVSMTESQLFSDSEKHECSRLMSRLLTFSSTNAHNGLTRDKAAQGKFIDDALAAWTDIKPKLLAMAMKVQKAWSEKSNAPAPAKKEPDTFFG